MIISHHAILLRRSRHTKTQRETSVIENDDHLNQKMNAGLQQVQIARQIHNKAKIHWKIFDMKITFKKFNKVKAISKNEIATHQYK